VLGLALGLEWFIVRFRHFQVQEIRRSARPRVRILPVAAADREHFEHSL